MEDKDLEKVLLEGAHEVQLGAPCVIEVQGKKYKVKQVSQKVALQIRNLEKEVLVLEREAKSEITLKLPCRGKKRESTNHPVAPGRECRTMLPADAGGHAGWICRAGSLRLRRKDCTVRACRFCKD